MIPTEEPVDQRYRLRFSLGQGGQSVVSHGYSIKFILIDEKNLLLYRNILEIGYSVVKRAVKEKSERGKKDQMPHWNQKTMRLLSRNFIDQSCKITGEEYRPKLKKAMRRLLSKINQTFPAKD
ncbi:MAG: hypothetical protein JRN15_01975 [Nitrososphaerota archaeon]|nr:hypothetical protein [Nitrososphaerota archaeon]